MSDQISAYYKICWYPVTDHWKKEEYGNFITVFQSL